MVRTLIVTLSLTLLAPAVVRGQSRLPPSLRDVGFDQRLGAQLPLDLTFRDESGRTVTLGDYFGERPVILILAYYRCPMLCGQVHNGLVRALHEVPFDAGKDFTILTVSFDPRETPEQAAAAKSIYVERYGRPGAEAGWHFLTGDETSIRRLTDTVGFRFTYDAANDQYAHAGGLMLVTPTGRLSRYFYDIHFSPLDMRLGLVEASQNRIGSPVDRILLYCFHYDPSEGRYGPTILNFVRVGGVLTLIGIGVFVIVLCRQGRRHPPTTAPSSEGEACSPT